MSDPLSESPRIIKRLKAFTPRLKPEWQKAIKVAANRIGITPSALLLISVDLLSKRLIADPAIQDAIPITKACSTNAEERFRAYCESQAKYSAPAADGARSSTMDPIPLSYRIGAPSTDPNSQEYFRSAVEGQVAHGKSMEDIAAESGYANPIMIHLIIQDRVLVQMERIPALARSLDIETTALLRWVLRHNWDVDGETVDAVLSELMTAEERDILWRIRQIKSRK